MLRKTTLVLLIFMLFFQQIARAEKVWQAQNTGISDLDVRSISVFPGDDNFTCAASSKTVYLSQNSGELWEKTFSLEAEADEINFVTFDFFNPKVLYLATTKGLFVTKNRGRDWENIFRRVSEAANDVSWIALDLLDARKIYIGTKESLYVSSDSGETWRKSNGGLPGSPVRSVVVHPSNSQVLYLANNYGLFKSIDTAQTWKRIYVTSPEVLDDEDKDESAQISEDKSLINCVAIDKGNPKKIFIATGEGVFVSQDAGELWNKLPAQGLSCDYVNFIVVSDKNGAVYTATKEGVFEFLPELNRWQEIYQGLTARDVRSLALNRKGKQLFAGTDRGIFKTIDINLAQKQNREEKDKNIKIDFEQALKGLSANEPTIRQVQEAALRYAEVVHPDRIKALRRNARLKALLPDVSLDYDKTIYSATGKDYSNIVIGPRDWGLTLSWDVGDLIFSEQVRLIDSNTRLMVQLRDDILNEVTRLYYERRKLQTELILTPPETPHDKLAKTLRLEELTANIDALTGGYFSRNLKNK